jgi:quinolinate synthase
VPGYDESCLCQDCPYMKLNTLEKIKSCLETMSPEIQVHEETRIRAQLSLQRMMDISEGRKVTW